jgi:copper(I)-binding protein
MRKLFGLVLLATVFAVPAFAGDVSVGSLSIKAPWARATPEGAKVGAGYMSITNSGKEADSLVAGSLPQAGLVQIHEMAVEGGVMKMRELPKGLEIAPGATVELKPGSYHVMFMELKEPIKQGAPLKGTLQFAKAGSVTVEYVVQPIGAQAPDGAHKGH